MCCAFGYCLPWWLSLSPVLFMSPCFSPSLLVFCFSFVPPPPPDGSPRVHIPFLRSLAPAAATASFPLTPGRGLLYGVCPQSTHSIVCLPLAGQSNPAAHARLPAQQEPSARLGIDGMGPRLGDSRAADIDFGLRGVVWATAEGDGDDGWKRAHGRISADSRFLPLPLCATGSLPGAASSL